MSFTFTLARRTISDGVWIAYGTYDATGVTTGEIATGLNYIEVAFLTCTGNAVQANAPSIDESFPFVGGTITIDCDSGDTGNWIAFGRI